MAKDYRAICATHTGHHNKSPKDHQQWAAINASAPWVDQELSPHELVAWIKSGKAWTACHLGGQSHSQDNVVASNLIVLDIDGDLTLEEFWAIAAVQRHCLFTATTCSHTEDEHRFRAVFACDLHDDVDLHGAIYDLLLDRLGIKLKDNCGRKPERLWYGNDKAEVRFGEGQPIPWDLIENARDNVAEAHTTRPRVENPSNPEELARDLRRAEWVLLHMLRPSQDNEYNSYWQIVLNAAAATSDEAVFQAFLQWHRRGHHINKNRNVEKRLQKAGTRLTPAGGAHKLLSFAKEQHGDEWWLQMPKDLWYGAGSSSYRPPTVLMRGRSASDIAPFETIWTPGDVPPPNEPEHCAFAEVKPPTILMRGRSEHDTAADGTPRTPDVVPTVTQLKKLASTASHVTLGTCPSEAAALAQPSSQPSQSEQIAQLLVQLYTVETERKLLTAEGELLLTAQEARYKADQLESELQSFAVFRNNPQRIRARLLEIFREINGIAQRSDHNLQVEDFLSEEDSPNEYLIDGLFVRGASYLIYAPTGAGKTKLGILLARAALGTPGQDEFLGFKAKPTEPFSGSRVLFIASDGGLFAKGDANHYLKVLKQDTKEWVRYMKCFSGHRRNNASPWRMNIRGLHKLVSTLDEFAAAGTPVRLLVIDSLKACMPENTLVGDQVVTAYLEVIEAICAPRNITTIYLHHQSKEGDQPQGVAGLTEIVHGHFRIRVEDDRRSFCINKLRDGKGSRREIPYEISPDGDLLIRDSHDNQTSNSPERILIKMFAEHYAKHLRDADKLAPDNPKRRYKGIQRSEIPGLLQERGFDNPSWRKAANLDRPLLALVKTGQIKKLFYGFYAIGHAEEYSPSQQEGLDLGESTLNGEGKEIPGWD